MEHTPVLSDAVTKLLAPQDGDIVLDATLGFGGHAKALCASAGITLIGIDADSHARQESEKVLTEAGCVTKILGGNFRNLKELLAREGITEINRALFDLGVSSYQLDSAGRGFSFRESAYGEPLGMTLSDIPEESVANAETIVNEWREETLADIIYGFGEERYAKRIARALVEARKEKGIHTVGELVGIIHDAVPARYRNGRIHFATRTFQALRMAANDELGALKEGLESTWEVLADGGRIAVISFHSIEDRVVKRQFQEYARAGGGMLITKKPVVAEEKEVTNNPRARSAKLRVIEKNTHD